MGQRIQNDQPKKEGDLMRNRPAATLSFSSVRAAHANDIVIASGRVIDPETGIDAIRNLAVEDVRIIAISKVPMKENVVIDATGHLVSPGFIDRHSHCTNISD